MPDYNPLKYPSLNNTPASRSEAYARRAEDEKHLFSLLSMFEGSPSESVPLGNQELAAARKAVFQWIVPTPEESFTNIIGNEEALAQLRDAILGPLTHAETYAAYGIPAPLGAMLYGPPGCGKTMFGKAAVSEMSRAYGKKCEFLSVNGASLQAPYVGETEKLIAKLFNYARLYKKEFGHPLLIFIDEADVAFPSRNNSSRRVYSYEESRVAAFLAEMDGMQECGAFVLLTTNRPEALDSALLRDGRCDFKIKIERPMGDDIEKILTNAFAKTITKATLSELVFAAVEEIRDPFKILDVAKEAEYTKANGLVYKSSKDFTFEHIVTGAMLAAIPAHAARIAFSRDIAREASAPISGVTVADVTAACHRIFEESKGLDHSYAQNAFIEKYHEEIRTKEKRGLN